MDILDLEVLGIGKARAFAECPRHLYDFSGIDYHDSKLYGKNVKCLRCEAHVPLIQAKSYVQGFVAGGHRASDVSHGLKFPINDTTEATCPQCDGKGRPQSPGAWRRGEPCPLCSAVGKVERNRALEFLKNRDGRR